MAWTPMNDTGDWWGFKKFIPPEMSPAWTERYSTGKGQDEERMTLRAEP